MVTGATGVAGEIGHIKVVPNGRLCGCGERGCLEAYTGGLHLMALAREAIAKGEGRKLLELAGGDEANITPPIIERAAIAGDEAAAAIHRHAGELLGLAFANQVTVLNPARLILGGGVLANCPKLMALVIEGIERYALWVSRKAAQIVAAQLGDDSGIIGAALLARA
jgi:glucokinase